MTRTRTWIGCGMVCLMLVGCGEEETPDEPDTEVGYDTVQSEDDRRANCQSRPDFDEICATGGGGECGAYCPDTMGGDVSDEGDAAETSDP